MNPSVTPVRAAYAKKRSSPTEAGIRRMARVRPKAIASWAMTRGRKRPARSVTCASDMPATTAPTPVVNSRPRNIQKNAWVRNACASRASGRTPTRPGVAYGLNIMVRGISFVATGTRAPDPYSLATPKACTARGWSDFAAWSAAAGAVPGPGRRRGGGLCLLGGPREDPQQVGEAVEVGQEVRPGHEPGAIERHGPPLRPPDDGSGKLERGARAGLAGHDELPRELDPGLVVREHGLDPGDHRGRDARRPVLEAVPCDRVGGQLRARHEQLALDPEDQRLDLREGRGKRAEAPPGVQLGPGEPQRSDGLVQGAVGLGAEIVLGNAIASEEEARGAVVALLRGNGGCARCGGGFLALIHISE